MGRKDSEDSQLFSPSFSSSSSISPSTTDSSVISETNIRILVYDETTHKKLNVAEQVAEPNDDTIIPAIDSHAGTDTKPSDIAIITTASYPVSAPATPTSSSSTSIPLPTPFDSSRPTSTTPSTTNVNNLDVDDSGIPSLLRHGPQISQNLNVKFAPLPELKPRKRKSSTPLGMAARSQLARRRRRIYQPSYEEEESYRPKRFNPPKIPEKERMEAIDGLQEGSTWKKKSKKLEEGGKEGEEEGSQLEEEDSLAMLAKKMGRAGKNFWRKMSIGGKGGKSNAGEDSKTGKVEPVLSLVKSPRLSDKKHQGVEESLGRGEVAEEYPKTGSVYIEDTLHEGYLSFISPPLSDSRC